MWSGPQVSNSAARGSPLWHATMGHALAAWPSVINHRNQIIAIHPNIPNKYPLYRVYMGLIITGPPSPRVFYPRFPYQRIWLRRRSQANHQKIHLPNSTQNNQCFSMVTFQLDDEPNYTIPPGSLTQPLKMDGWKMSFLLGFLIFRGYVKLRGGMHNQMVFTWFLLSIIAVVWKTNPFFGSLISSPTYLGRCSPLYTLYSLDNTGWWLNQPIWKILVKMGIFPK